MRKFVIISDPVHGDHPDTYIIDAYTDTEFNTALDLIGQTLKTHACNEYTIKVTADDRTPGVSPLTPEPCVTLEELQELDAIAHTLTNRQLAHMSYPVVCVAQWSEEDGAVNGSAALCATPSDLIRAVADDFDEQDAADHGQCIIGGYIIDAHGDLWRYDGSSKCGPVFILRD